MALTEKKCTPWHEKMTPLPMEHAKGLIKELHQNWSLNAEGHLARKYDFPDFAAAMDFANDVTRIAEQEKHHPDLHIAWNNFDIEIWTHRAGGVTENDFILAAKIDQLTGR